MLADQSLEMSCFSGEFLTETGAILQSLDQNSLEDLAQGLASVRNSGGRLFILGVGGWCEPSTTIFTVCVEL